MRIIKSIKEMREFVAEMRQAGKSIGLAPTMGALHAGHLELMSQAKSQCDVVVVSIFVNPIQFGPNEDFAKYPRDLASDAQKTAGVGVDAVFYPTPEMMYPDGFATYVNVEGITDKLCGLSRPGHFRGVVTVVCKLFHIVKPDKAFFGQKDAQQVAVIRRMTDDLDMDIDIQMIPIVREESGLAMSSRNEYLSPLEREAALVLSRSLEKAQQAFSGGEKTVEILKALVAREIKAEPMALIDYVEAYRYPDLAEVEQVEDKVLLALAVYIGKTRLIDNIILEA